MAKDKQEPEKKEKKKRRGHGEGSIYQRKDGRWVAEVSYRDPVTNTSKRKPLYGNSRPEVIAAKKAFEKELNSGITPANKITTGQWLETWLKTYARINVRQNTFEEYERAVKKHLVPTLGKYLLKDLRPEYIQDMLNKKAINGNLRTGGPLGGRQLEHTYIVLNMALEQARKNQIISRNPCVAVVKPKKEKKEFIPWTTEQTNHFLASVKGERLFPLYMVAWGTGLRRSEILGLQWPDINMKQGTLTVRRALVRVKNGCVFGEPKTERSRRTIPLPDPVIKELKRWRKAQVQEEVKWRGLHKDLPDEEKPEFNPLKMVFCNEAGEPMNPDFVTRSFKRDREAAKLPPIRFHDLRHGHATMLLELGEDIKVISDRLGHSSITITADVYSHVREKMQREASDKLAKVLKI